MKNSKLKTNIFNHLSFEERASIAVLLLSGETIIKIANLLGRYKSTISREIRRN